MAVSQHQVREGADAGMGWPWCTKCLARVEKAAQFMASKSNRAPRYVTGELFCGAGGLSRGFHEVGFASKFANDIWDVALHAFLKTF